ncbi:MAG TPA: hypothetical protein VG711_09650 [Phycisphaerales bacterium]|nr:hypothetical protein [Phycisphaerales bacterium]
MKRRCAVSYELWAKEELTGGTPVPPEEEEESTGDMRVPLEEEERLSAVGSRLSGEDEEASGTVSTATR